MRTVIQRALPLVLFASVASAQTLPLEWNRFADWAEPPASAAGTTQGNPAPDSMGNLVWNYEWLYWKCCPGSTWAQWEPSVSRMVWDPAWFTGPGGWVVQDDLNSLIDRSALYDLYGPGLHVPTKYKPFVRWENTTGQSFSLDIVGELVVWWYPGQTVPATSVDVAIVFCDASSALAKTSLYYVTVDKPSSTSGLPESLTLPTVSVLGVSVDPGDMLLVSVSANTWSGGNNFVLLIDRELSLYRNSSGLASETVRLGVPANPNVLQPGLTSGPIIGNTWDPVIDHTSFATGASTDFLGVSAQPPINTALGIGTLLIVPPTGPKVFYQTPGMPFSVTIPDDSALVGFQGVCQGGSITPGSGVELTNALDLVLGAY